MRSWSERLAARANGRPFAACAGIDASPGAVALLARAQEPPRGDRRVTRAGAMERFGGMVVEAVRDHAAAVKLQVAWFETAGAPGFRALERVVEHARHAGLLVVLDARRGEHAPAAAAYADAWLGEEAASGVRCDALTVHAAIADDALAAMTSIATARSAGLYVAGDVASHERPVHGCADGIVGALVEGDVDHLARTRTAMPTAALLVTGVRLADVAGLARLATDAARTSLVSVSDDLLPAQPLETAAFRHAVTSAAQRLAQELPSSMV